jgi:hypothetical protein
MKRDWKKSVIPLLFAWAFVTESQVASATAITGSATAPTTNIAVSFTDASPSYTWKSKDPDDEEQMMGETFQVGASSFVADKVTLLVRVADTIANVPFKFTLFHASQSDDAGGTFAGLSGVPTADTIMAEFTGTFSFTGSANNLYLTYDFDDVTLAANEWYGFYGGIDGYNPAYGSWLSSRNGNGDGAAYPGTALRLADSGRRYVTFSGGDGADTAFWVQEAAPPVPEPGTAVLAFMGLVSLVGIARCRQSRD